MADTNAGGNESVHVQAPADGVVMRIYETSAQADVAASAERVWEVVTDITVMPRFSAELVGVEWAEGFSAAALGAQFVGRNRNGAIGEWTTLSRVIAFDPPARFGWAVGDPENPAATWTFDLTPTAAGTHVNYTARIGPGPSGVTMLIERSPHRADSIVQGRLSQLRDAMTRTLAGIRQLAEGP